MHAVAHQITHQAMVAAVASAAAGNDLEGEDWAVGRSSWWWALSAGRQGLNPQLSLMSLFATHRTAGARLPNSTNSGGDCPAHSSTGSAFSSWGTSSLWSSGEQGLGEVPVGKSWWIVGRTRLNPPVPQQGAGLGTNTSLAQMVSGLVGQLLMQPVLVGESCSFLAQTLDISSCHWV